MGSQALTSIVWQTLLALVLFAAAMCFSASETALLSLSRPRLKKLISQRPLLAPDLTQWLSAPQYLLTTILVGNTLSNVVTTLLVTNVAIACFPSIRVAWVETAVWLLMTVVLFVLGEFIPKTIGRHYPQRVTLMGLPWISRLTRLVTPAIRRFLGFIEKRFPLFEGVPVGRLSVYTLEEFREMIQANAAQGELPHRSVQMMERALGLRKIPVSKIMTPFEKVESVNLGVDADRVLDRVSELGRTRVPAYRSHPRKIGGYLHVKDLLLAWRGVLPLSLDVLLRQPLYVSPTRSAGELLEDFRRGVSHMAVVQDERGDCLGIVTLEDVLEEVIGEILDEYDIENPRGVH